MKKMLFIGILMCLCVSVSDSQCQCLGKKEKGVHMGISAGVSTMGGGLEASVRVMPHLSFSAGWDYLPISLARSFSIDASNYDEYIPYNPDLMVDFSYASSLGHILASWYPSCFSSFFLSGGIYVGNVTLDGLAILVNPETGENIIHDLDTEDFDFDNMPTYVFEEGYTFKPNSDASAGINMKLGKALKPYLGIGWGYAVPYSRIDFKFDLGCIYSGKPEVSLPNLIEGDVSDLSDYWNGYRYIDKYARWLPVIRFQLMVRLF